MVNNLKRTFQGFDPTQRSLELVVSGEHWFSFMREESVSKAELMLPSVIGSANLHCFLLLGIYVGSG